MLIYILDVIRNIIHFVSGLVKNYVLYVTLTGGHNIPNVFYTMMDISFIIYWTWWKML